VARSDSEPLLRGSINDTARSLLESAKDDAPDSGARDRMLSALAAAPSETGGRLRELVRAGGPSIHGLAVVLVLSAGAALAVSASWDSRSASGELSPPAQSEAAAPLASVAPTNVSGNVPPAIPVVTLEALPSVPASEPNPSPKVAPKRTQPAPGQRATSRPQESTLAREIAQVEAARTSLAAGDAARTLVILDQYDREFPTGAFAVEISVLRIEALARAGRTDEARRLGSEFLATHRQGAFARRVAITLDSTNNHRAAASASNSARE
jgi:hypothetical protein